MLTFQRLESLWHSVENIKSWLETFYNIPCSKLLGQPFHFWFQMILTITLLEYLSTLKDPAWDCQAVRSTVNLMSALDCMLQRLDLASKEPELQGSDDHLLLFLSKLLQKCRLWGETRWNLDQGSGQGQEQGQMEDIQSSCQGSIAAPPVDVESDAASQYLAQAQAQHIPDLDQMAFMQSMNLGDDHWFDNVLGMSPTSY